MSNVLSHFVLADSQLDNRDAATNGQIDGIGIVIYPYSILYIVHTDIKWIISIAQISF